MILFIAKSEFLKIDSEKILSIFKKTVIKMKIKWVC